MEHFTINVVRSKSFRNTNWSKIPRNEKIWNGINPEQITMQVMIILALLTVLNDATLCGLIML